MEALEGFLRDFRDLIREWPKEQENLRSLFELHFNLRSHEVESRLAQVRFHIASYHRFTVSLVRRLELVSPRADSMFATRLEIIRHQALDLEAEAVHALTSFGITVAPRDRSEATAEGAFEEAEAPPTFQGPVYVAQR